MSTIIDVQPVATEIVIRERVATSEFRIIEIQENIIQRSVVAEIEFGPFTEMPGPMPGMQSRTVGTGRRGVRVWNGDDYDAIRDTWKNTDLIAKIKEILDSGNS